MIVENNISPLPFYDSLKFQNHRKSYAYGNIYPLITKGGEILPFQFVIDASTIPNPNTIKVQLTQVSTGEVIDISTEMKEYGLTATKYADAGFVLVKYPGRFSITTIKYEGQYYLTVTLSGVSFYSDIFTVMFDVSRCVCLEYRNSTNLSFKGGMVDFSDNFTFKCYLDSAIGKPEYSFEEEAVERMGYTFIESQVSKKVYKFVFVAPEYLCDALRIARLCDSKKVTYLEREYDMLTFSFEPTWETQGDLASVEVEFETDNIMYSLGGYTPEPSGDFSSDFNNDFKIEE